MNESPKLAAPKHKKKHTPQNTIPKYFGGCLKKKSFPKGLRKQRKPPKKKDPMG